MAQMCFRASFDVVEGNSKFFAHDGVLYFKTGGVINEKEELWLIAYPSNKSMNLQLIEQIHELK